MIILFNSGETPLLYLARRNSSPTIRKILESKNVKENQMLDLSVKSKEGKTVLHYLVENRDEQVKLVLLNVFYFNGNIGNNLC